MNNKCIACGHECTFEGNPDENPANFPMMWGGIIFRSTGQFGSRVKDCAPAWPLGATDEIQIIVCDRCIIGQHMRVDYIKDRKSTHTAVCVPLADQYDKRQRKDILRQLNEDDQATNRNKKFLDQLDVEPEATDDTKHQG